jgi:hypothetical protein
MPKKLILFLLILFLILGGGLIFLKSQKKTSQNENLPRETEIVPPYFIVEKVYFSETEDPKNVLLNIKVKRNKVAEYKYEIHFPPQEGAPQGIGPIEIEEGARPSEFKEEVVTTPETIIQEFIARSYPDKVPEFGKSYFCKIKFYLTNGKELNWEGDVNWEKME